jgi:hypothetical protein
MKIRYRYYFIAVRFSGLQKMNDIIGFSHLFNAAKAKWRFVLIRPLAEANGNELLCQMGMN